MYFEIEKENWAVWLTQLTIFGGLLYPLGVYICSVCEKRSIDPSIDQKNWLFFIERVSERKWYKIKVTMQSQVGIPVLLSSYIRPRIRNNDNNSQQQQQQHQQGVDYENFR